MKRYPKYGQPGFYREYLYLFEQPRTSADAYRQIFCLGELAKNGPHKENDFRPEWKLSKRRMRVLRTYWALRRMEQKGA